YPGTPVSSWLSTTIESSGIATTFRFSMDFSGLLGLWAKDTKGTAKKARTTNANTFFIIHFLLLIITLEAPPGVSCVKNAIGGLYVVNSLYSFSCEINTNYVCGCICIDLRGGDSRINCSKGLKVVSQPLYVFPYPERWAGDCTMVAADPVLPLGYVVSASRIADRRMILAGYRLADLLMRLLIR